MELRAIPLRHRPINCAIVSPERERQPAIKDCLRGKRKPDPGVASKELDDLGSNLLLLFREVLGSGSRKFQPQRPPWLPPPNKSIPENQWRDWECDGANL